MCEWKLFMIRIVMLPRYTRSECHYHRQTLSAEQSVQSILRVPVRVIERCFSTSQRHVHDDGDAWVEVCMFKPEFLLLFSRRQWWAAQNYCISMIVQACIFFSIPSPGRWNTSYRDHHRRESRWEVARESRGGFSPSGILATPRVRDSPIWIQPPGFLSFNTTPGS